ncbi:class I SAM-dependent methyltransferase [Thermogemmatispora tikiterensis]|nr:class I SAM-dependent methyltransferase [Thermogemmatispora tikiterensis]
MQSYDILPAQHRILDLTCGPDGWDLELAFHFPNAHVLGVDINP